MIEVKIPDAYHSTLRLGTCSWKYDSWKGLLYEEKKDYRPDDYLADYARVLKTVEIDQWFWSLFPSGIKLPEPETVRKYADSVPPDFVFSVKAPNAVTLTHYYSKEPVRGAAGKPNPHFLDPGLLQQFLDRLSPLGKKLGPVMFQFEYLNKQKMPSLEKFCELVKGFLAKAPRGFLYAVEIRNPNYLSAAFFNFLKENELGYVYLEGYYMPPIGEVFDRFYPQTAPFSIIRLHGGHRAEIEADTGKAWNRIVSPQPASLQAAARIVRANTRRRALTYVNLNNHFEGSAPLSVERFLEKLRTQG